MLKKFILSIIVTLVSAVVSGQTTSSPPKLIVNIIVGAMRAGDIERYRSNFSEGGFVRLLDGGVNFTNANYNYHQTTTPVSLATLSTGAMPSSHGVIGRGWWEYILGERVELIEDAEVKNLNYNIRDYGYSAHRLISPTLSETLLFESPQSKCVSIALEPISSIVMGGGGGTPYWIDPLTCEWGSSTAFMAELPDWVVEYNKSSELNTLLNKRWVSISQQSTYINTFSSTLKSKLLTQLLTRRYEGSSPSRGKSRDEQKRFLYEHIAYTPAGNSAIMEYAKMVVERIGVGEDSNPDILNIYLDPARNIAQRYGVKSVEVEDMFRHLDSDLESFLSFLATKVDPKEMVVVLSSDHGISPSYNQNAEPLGRFNSQQFVVLVNSFLRARYGDDNWVLGYEDRNLYLNHQLIFNHGLSTSEVQNEVATFALQFRGVAHALTALSMRNSYFGSGYGHKMQNSFYPRRSGDILLNFMPGWIEEQEGQVADAGSTYRYDTHVPLIIYGEGYLSSQSIVREVTMEDLAPTLSRILQIDTPAAAEGRPIEEIF